MSIDNEDNESILLHNNRITNEIITQPNIQSISSHHTNKRKIQKSDLIIKNLKVQNNGISSPLKRSGSPLLNKYHRRLNSNLNNIKNNNKMITNILINYKQVISWKDKNYWIEVINEELQNLYDIKIMNFKKKIPNGVNPTTTKWGGFML